MARIRTVKPEFFRHEGLQDLEVANPGAYPMMVFAGLWCQCDKAGRFEWRPRQIKLDILPFLPFDMESTLGLLESGGFIRRYESGGKCYGEIPSFQNHQRIGGKEAQEPAKHPEPIGEATGKHSGSNGEALGIAGREGKGKEGNGVEATATARKRASPLPAGFEVSEGVREWAKREGYDKHLDAHLAYFTDWAASSRAVKVDWDAAFRNAIRADWGGVRKASGNGGSALYNLSDAELLSRATTLGVKTTGLARPQVIDKIKSKEAAL